MSYDGRITLSGYWAKECIKLYEKANSIGDISDKSFLRKKFSPSVIKIKIDYKSLKGRIKNHLRRSYFNMMSDHKLWKISGLPFLLLKLVEEREMNKEDPLPKNYEYLENELRLLGYLK